MGEPLWKLETLRRSLAMCDRELPATALSNGEAAALIARLLEADQQLRTLQSGIGRLS